MTARQKILVIGDALMGAAQLSAPTRELLEGDYEIVTEEWGLPLAETIAANLLIEKEGPAAVAVAAPGVDRAGVVAILTQFYPLSAETLEGWPDLRVVATLRAGTENIDADFLASAGIPLLRNLGRNANAVAELTVALMLSRLRGTGEVHHSLRTGGWRPATPPEGYRELAGMTVGLVGLGAVGALVFKRLSGFEVTALFSDPYADERVALAAGAQSVPLDELLGRSDIVSLHARSSPETHHLIGPAQLAGMRNDALLVNTARADLIDEVALVGSLERGEIAGAALDVYSIEPLPDDHVLRRLPNVQLSAHLAGSTVQARTRGPLLIAQRLADALRPR